MRTPPLLLLLVAALGAAAAASSPYDAAVAECGAGSVALLSSSQSAPQTLFAYSTLGIFTALALRFAAPVVLADIHVNCSAADAHNYAELLQLPHQPVAVSAVALGSIIEFDDYNDTVKVTPSSFVRRQLLDNATNWQFPNASEIMQKGAVQLTYADGNFSVSFDLQPSVKSGSHAAANPHMVLTANSTVLDVTIANFNYTILPTRPKASNTSHRLALEMFFYRLDSQKMTTREAKSIDDEYAPSIFRRRDFIVPATPPGATPQRAQSYFSFKPVAFGGLNRSPTNLSECAVSPLLNASLADNSLASQSLAVAFVNGDSISSSNISFGAVDDGWFNPSIVAWSAVAGLGEPGTDSLSMALLLTTTISVGLPGVVIVFGGIYAAVKRMRSRRRGYEPIN